MSNPTSTTLYRFYDADDRLLYVGIAGNPARRHHQHSKDKPWWTDVARSTMEHYPTRDMAAAAEVAAIITEQPLHNVVHNACGFTRWLKAQRNHPRRIAELARSVSNDPDWPRHGDLDACEARLSAAGVDPAIMETLYEAWTLWKCGDQDPTIPRSGVLTEARFYTSWHSNQLSILTTIYVDLPPFVHMLDDDALVLERHNRATVQRLFDADYHATIHSGASTIVSFTDEAPRALETITTMARRALESATDPWEATR